jgi:peptide deformylase
MSILKILQYPDLRLRRTATQVTDFNDSYIQKIIDDMLETLQQQSHAAALASTQLDIDNPPSITVINKIEGVLPETLCLINPKITEKQGAIKEMEGCMSIFPSDIAATIERAEEIKGMAQDRYGKTFDINVKGYLAKVIQHEIDHLHGTIYLDHLSKLKLALIKKKIAKLKQ